MAVKAFLDTSVLLSGLIDFGVKSRPAQRVFDLVADRALPKPSTAWHCCLEFYSVATRMPAEFRLSPSDAERLLKEEILGRLAVHDLPPDSRLSFLAAAARDDMIGGRIYDAHIADVARSAGVDVIVADNRRHFLAALRHGLRVETPEEYLESINRKP